jgi:hypothetical protein
MRAVTFAKDDVVDYMRKNFVSTWYNQAPQTYPPTSRFAVNHAIACNCLAEQGVAKGASAKRVLPNVNLPPGTGAGNVKIFFCTPDGEIINYLQGHWTPKEFVEHAEFARSLMEIYSAGGAGVRQEMIRLHHLCAQGHQTAAEKAQRELQQSPGDRRLTEEINAQRIRSQCHELTVQRLLQDPSRYMHEDLAVLRCR